MAPISKEEEMKLLRDFVESVKARNQFAYLLDFINPEAIAYFEAAIKSDMPPHLLVCKLDPAMALKDVDKMNKELSLTNQRLVAENARFKHDYDTMAARITRLKSDMTTMAARL